MRLINTLADVEAGLDALCTLDPRLIPVRASAGLVPLRRVEPGFASLCSIVVSQQISTASAAAIFGRLCALLDPLTPHAVLDAGNETFRQAGLSASKVRTLLAAAQATANGLDLQALCQLDAAAAIARLTALPGVGRWTAEIYLLFAAGHPDIFPARDIALQAAVAHALNLGTRPNEKALAEISACWSPWRGVAARLFWSVYRVMRGREGITAEAT